MIIVDSSIDIYGTVFANLDTFDLRNIQYNEKSYNMFVHLFLNQLLFRIKQFKVCKSNRMYLAIDSKSWRKRYFNLVKKRYFNNYYKDKEVTDEAYKGHREKSEYINFEKIFEIFRDVVYNLSKYTDIVPIKVKDTEADDIIGTICLNNPDEKITIISGDKDFKQLLVNDNIKMYNGKTHIYESVPNVDLFLKHHIIMGDRIDEVPAIKPRVGDKTAMKMLPTIDMLLNTNIDMKFRYYVNEKLIDLSKSPKYIQKRILYKYNSVKDDFNFDANEFIKFLQKYECREIIKKINGFSLNSDYVEENQSISGSNSSVKIINDFLDSL